MHLNISLSINIYMKKAVIQKIEKLQTKGKRVKHRKIIRRVFLIKKTNQMFISIPHNNGVEPGDYVEIIKIE